MSLFEDVQTIEINGKEVSKIEATIDGNIAILWEKQIEMVELTVVKVWDDNNNIQGRRPAQLNCTCTDGTNAYPVTLNNDNNWTASLTLPKYINGIEATYNWTEQSVLGYKQTGKTIVDDTTTFTNTLPNRPPPTPIVE